MHAFNAVDRTFTKEYILKEDIISNSHFKSCNQKTNNDDNSST